MKKITLYHPDINHQQTMVCAFQDALPDHEVIPWSENVRADYLISWKPAKKIFKTPDVKIIFSLGAGVDAFLSQPDLNKDVLLVRLEEAGMGKQMLEIILYGILHHSRDMTSLINAQQKQQWLGESAPRRHPMSASIGIMGLGQLGRVVASSLASLSYPVNGYSRRIKMIDNVKCFAEDQFDEFLANSEILVNLLPLTSKTENILNAELFTKLPHGAYLINVARGKHLVEEDLIPAMDSGQLSGALLDVFRTEPLPKEHPYWLDKRIIVTPHLAAITLENDAIKQISNNIRAFENNQSMTGVSDRIRGY